MLKYRVFFAAGLALAAQTVGAQGLPSETDARQAADAQLQSNINSEAAARAAADGTRQKSIDAEATARQAADTNLQSNINSEAAARAAADGNLQKRIDAEAAARQAADTSLQNSIASEANTRLNADRELDGRITSEVVTRMQAIHELRELIGNGGGGNGGGTVTVDCGSGGTIGQALAAGAARIIVRGTCNEAVTISRDDVTLQGDPAAGGTIQGPDANVNVVTVRGHRVTLEGLAIRNGRNGITAIGASNLTVRNVSVESAGRNGIAYAFGSSGVIDRCTSRLNTRDGIVLDAAYARITNCTITENSRNGILLVNGANSPMGFTDRFEAAPNFVRRNGFSGVSIALGSVATMAMSEITNNGFANRAPGIFVSYATVSLSGGNNISENEGPGISVTGSRVIVGDSGPGLSTVNQIRANGRAGPSFGVVGLLGSSILIRDAQIVGNNGAGLGLQMRSVGQITNSNIESNTRNGIELVLGAGLGPFSSPSGTTVTGNTGLGLICADSETSVTMAGFPGVPTGLVFSGNTLGDFSCTSFDQPPAFTPPPPPPPGPVPGT